MNLHEYQSKRLFADYGIAVPRGIPADSADAAVKAAEELGGELWVVKAQVHAGGRGKAGGVKLARTLDEVRDYADGMLGTQLVTHQSGPEGLPVNVVYIEEGSEIDRELYLSMLVDREVSRISFIASAAGGMDIEKVAEETPEKIFTVVVAPDAGLQDYQARQLAFGLGLDKQQMRQFACLIKKLYRLYLDCDASLIEVNPLITNEGRRHRCARRQDQHRRQRTVPAAPKSPSCAIPSQEDEAGARGGRTRPQLRFARRQHRLHGERRGPGDGNDGPDQAARRRAGQLPGRRRRRHGGARCRGVQADPVERRSVEAILVNIFGGIVRCDLIAEGIISAVKEVGVSMPVVVRLEGTNVNKGRELLAEQRSRHHRG